MIRERTFAGLEAARARGKNGGRTAKMTERQVAQTRAMLEDREISVGEVCETFGVSKTTLYRHLNKGDAGEGKGSEAQRSADGRGE